MTDRRAIKGQLYAVVSNVIRASEVPLRVPDIVAAPEVQEATQYHAQPAGAVRRQVINLLYDGLIEAVGDANTGGVRWKGERL